MPPADEIDAPPAIRSRLHKLGLERREDLVLHLPLRYEDETRVTAVAEAPLGVPLQVEVLVVDSVVSMAPRRQLLVTVSDASDVSAGGGPTEPSSPALSELLRQPAAGFRERAPESTAAARLRRDP
jgi:hypothetical protein